MTPFMAGGSVASILQFCRPEGLEERAIAAIGRATLAGLAYIHAHAGIHRDVARL